MSNATTTTSNLPKWPGASACYSRAYRLLEAMAQAGHVRRETKRGRTTCYPSDEMNALIKALNRGDEATIKCTLQTALLLGQHAAAQWWDGPKVVPME